MSRINLDEHIPYIEFYKENVSGCQPAGDDQFIGRCPFHDDQAPSFSFNTKSGLWSCKAGCGSGNAVTFYARLKGLSSKEAYKALCREYNAPGFNDDQKPRSGKKKLNPNSETPQEVKSHTIPHQTLDALPQIPEQGVQALQKSRGWAPEIIQQYNIRFNPKDDSRIQIPVYDASGKLVNIRRYLPKAPSGTPKILSYKRGYGKTRLWPLSILKEKDPIILCEGEPDALCGLSHGLHCITQTAGCETWKGKEFNESFRGRHVIIAYDADKPGKKGAEKVANSLVGIASKVEVINWPSDIMPEQEDHGADLTDFFVKHQKTTEDFLSLSRAEFKPDATNEIIKNGVKFSDGDIIEKDGCYFRLKYTTQGPDEIKISNFTLKIIKTYAMPDGVVRNVKLISAAGYTTPEIQIQAIEMTTKYNFATWCLKQGNFLWKGTAEDLQQIWEIETEAADQRMIMRPDHIGWIPEHKIWLFGDSAVRGGEVFTPDKDRIIWVSDTGFQPLTLNNDERSTTFFPMVRYDLSGTIITETRAKMVKYLKANLGGFEAYLVLGYVAACAYSEEIFREYKFPLLFLYGKRYCGKNTLAKFIMAHFGLSEASAGTISKLTAASLNAGLSYYSSIPLWVDEYGKDPRKTQEFLAILTSVYDRIGTMKGKLGYGVVTSPVRSAMILTGENAPDDAALGSRCALIHLSTQRRQDAFKPALEQIVPQLSGIFHQLIREKTSEKAGKLIGEIAHTQEFLREHKGLDPRIASIYAILAESFVQFYNPEDFEGDNAGFAEWVQEEAYQAKEDNEENYIVNDFFSDMEVLRAAGRINGQHVNITYDSYEGGGRPKEAVLWLKGIHSEIEADRRRRGLITPSYQDIRRYLGDEPYCVTRECTPRRIDGKNRRSMVLWLDNMPEHLRDMLCEGWCSSSPTGGDGFM